MTVKFRKKSLAERQAIQQQIAEDIKRLTQWQQALGSAVSLDSLGEKGNDSSVYNADDEGSHILIDEEKKQDLKKRVKELQENFQKLQDLINERKGFDATDKDANLYLQDKTRGAEAVQEKKQNRNNFCRIFTKRMIPIGVICCLGCGLYLEMQARLAEDQCFFE